MSREEQSDGDASATGPAPVVSVVVCTHNRADWLRKALTSVVEQLTPATPCEILVVDNRSTDATRDVVRSFGHAPEVRYVYEQNLGLCHARNAGWRHARGKYVAYLDDDAVAAPGWLDSIREAFEREPTAGVVGGKVTPVWECDRPPWMSEQLSLCLTVVDWSPEAKLITDLDAEWLVGANMAVPRAVMQELDGFDARLDRVGKRMLSSGDVFLQKQIVKRGYTCLYHPGMAVDHLVPASRVHKDWFRRRYFWQGVSDVVMQLIEESPSRRQRLSEAAAKTRLLLRSRDDLGILWKDTDDPERYFRKCMLWIQVGRIAGLLGLARK